MSKQTINIGASPNDGTGTPLRTSFDYTNQNFTEIYTALGGGVALPGATTQVIFNDGGTNLAGDAGLVYNKTTDALTVAGLVTAGSATITGAATVGTTLGVTGVSTFAAGTALLPALTTTGDVNTGIYYPAADTFAVTTGGTERYRVNSIGLGIGASPGLSGGSRRALTVNAITGEFPILELAINGSLTGYLFSNTTQTSLVALGTAFLHFEVSSVERARIDSGGTFRIKGLGTAGSTDAVQFSGSAPASAMTLDASGNLLVGTVTSPAGTKVGAIAKLSGVSVEGTAAISVSTTPVAIGKGLGTGGLFFVTGFNTTGGAQGWWLVASTGGLAPTVIASGNNTGLTVAFTTVAGVVYMNTASGTISIHSFAVTNS